jgi:hypothetical protein
VLNDGREANPVWDLESAHERPFVQKAGEARGGRTTGGDQGPVRNERERRERRGEGSGLASIEDEPEDDDELSAGVSGDICVKPRQTPPSPGSSERKISILVRRRSDGAAGGGSGGWAGGIAP